jgi:hypothetical protein
MTMASSHCLKALTQRLAELSIDPLWGTALYGLAPDGQAQLARLRYHLSQLVPLQPASGDRCGCVLA